MNFLISLVIFFLALTVHEFAHGWVALKRGDSTAAHLGRLTLNPLAHIDPVGTVILPILLVMTRAPFIIGWAKPVPINYLNLKNPKSDMMLVGLAGPLANIIFAFILGLIAQALEPNATLYSLLKMGILINLFLAIFNLIPVPPLDGSRILMGLLPQPLAYQYAQIEPFGFIIVIALLWLGLIGRFIFPIVGILMHLFLGA